MAAPEIKKIAIVLSGGLSRGAAQVSFANELVKKVGHERVCVVTGASIGAINAYSIGVGHTDELVDIYSDLDCDTTKQFVRNVKNGLFNDTFNKIEDSFLMPVYVSTTRMFGFDCSYFCLNHMTRKDLKSALNASMAFPTINGPIRFANHLWIDGGATDNIPYYPVTYFDPDMVIIVHCYSRYYPPQHLFDSLKKDTIVIDIDVSLNFPDKISSFSFTKKDFKTMIDVGREDGKAFADLIFSDFYTENVRQRCYKYINENMERRRKKNWNGYIELVEMLNTLYQLKEGKLY